MRSIISYLDSASTLYASPKSQPRTECKYLILHLHLVVLVLVGPLKRVSSLTRKVIVVHHALGWSDAGLIEKGEQLFCVFENLERGVRLGLVELSRARRRWYASAGQDVKMRRARRRTEEEEGEEEGN